MTTMKKIEVAKPLMIGQMLSIAPIQKLRDWELDGMIRGWGSYPGSSGYHRTVYICNCVGIVVESRGRWFSVLVDGRLVWIDRDVLKMASIVLTP